MGLGLLVPEPSHGRNPAATAAAELPVLETVHAAPTEDPALLGEELVALVRRAPGPA